MAEMDENVVFSWGKARRNLARTRITGMTVNTSGPVRYPLVKPFPGGYLPVRGRSHDRPRIGEIGLDKFKSAPTTTTEST
jgi:hypothetical protein